MIINNNKVPFSLFIHSLSTSSISKISKMIELDRDNTPSTTNINPIRKASSSWNFSSFLCCYRSRSNSFVEINGACEAGSLAAEIFSIDGGNRRERSLSRVHQSECVCPLDRAWSLWTGKFSNWFIAEGGGKAWCIDRSIERLSRRRRFLSMRSPLVLDSK